MKALKRIPLVLIGALGATAVQAAPSTWIEVKSQHFTVVSNAGEKEARRTAWQFEQIRQALLLIWPWAKVDGGPPLTIVAARDENTLKSIAPQYWEGKRFRPVSFWVSGRDSNYIALRTDIAEPDDVGENPYQQAYWNYVSLIFNRSIPVAVPYWYRRGVAEVLSNTLVRAKEIHVGRLMQGHIDRLRQSALIPPDEFFSVDRGSKYLTQEADAWQYEAQAWLFVHYLMFGEKGAHRSKISAFEGLLIRGTSADQALKESLGPDMKPYFDGMRGYLKQQIFMYGRFQVAVDLKPEIFGVRTIAPVDAALVRSRILVAMRRPVEARAFSAEAAQLDPANPGPSEIEGFLLDGEQKKTEAQTAFEKALSQGSMNARVYYRLAQLNWAGSGENRAQREKVESLLRKALEIDPAYPAALSYLADTLVDLDRSEEAVDLAKKAANLEPEDTYHRIALARALWHLGRTGDAEAVAKAALLVADTEAEKARVQEFLDFVAKNRRR